MCQIRKQDLRVRSFISNCVLCPLIALSSSSPLSLHSLYMLRDCVCASCLLGSESIHIAVPWQALNCNIVQPCSEWFSEQRKAMQGLSRGEYFSNREICTPTRPQGFLPSAGLTHRMSTVTGQCKAYARSISGKQGQLRKINVLEIFEVKCLPH